MTKLTKTTAPGIFRRHKGGCTGKGRCDCAYVVVWRHRGAQHKATFRTMAEAREAQAQRKAGESRPVAKITVGDYFNDWIETYSGRTARGFSETSRGLYRQAITDYALPTWRTWKLAEIEPTDVRALFLKLDHKGRSTLKTLRAALSAMYATAAEDGIVRSNPIRGVRLPNGRELEEEKRAKALTLEELRLLIAAVPDEWKLFIEFLAVTGLRIGEAVGLTWENVSLGGAPYIEVRQQIYRGERKRLKSRDGRREIPLSTSIAERLLAHRRDSYGGPKAPVFATSTGTPLDPHNLRRTMLNPVAVELGHYEEVEGEDGKPRKRTTLGWHRLRHTCASLLFAEGRNIKQVQEWLGHADPSITIGTYIHLLDDGIGEALDLWGNKKATEGPETAENEAGSNLAETAA